LVSAFFIVLVAGDLAAQKRKPIKPKKKTSTSKKQEPKKSAAPGGSPQWFKLVEIMGGHLAMVNSGDFLNYQKQYYFTENPDFLITGEFPRQTNYLLAGGFHVGKLLKHPVIRFISGGFMLNWTGRSLVHNVSFTNNAFNRPDRITNKISISEKYRAAYLCPELQLRFGSKVYGLLGIRKEILMNGVRERTLTVESDFVQSGTPLVMTQKWNLKNSAVVRQNNWGIHAGLGYMPIPWFGLRLGYLYTGTFFNSGPDFATHQYYLALCFGFIK